MSRNKTGFVHIFLLIVIVLIGIVGIGYLAFNKVQIKIPSQQTWNSSSTPATSEANTSNWQTYINKDRKISFKFPDSWELKEFIDTEDAYYPFDVFGKKLALSKIILEKDNYLITYIFNFSSTYYEEPPVCLYNDTSESFDIGTFSPVKYENSEFVTIKTNHAIIRRTSVKSKENKSLRWEICKSSTLGTYYEPTHISYSIPTSYDPKVVNEMDQILSTFEIFSVNTDDQDTLDLINYLTEVYYSQAKEFGVKKEEIEININKIEDNFAVGTYSARSGGIWFALKDKGAWILIESTQEPPSCNNMNKYNFPKTFYEICI